MKYVLLFSIAALILIFTTSQTLPTKSSPKPLLTDSTKVISFKDIRNFDTYLKDNVSMSAYTKLSPEATLTELWNWKIKQLSDTTKKK